MGLAYIFVAVRCMSGRYSRYEATRPAKIVDVEHPPLTSRASLMKFTFVVIRLFRGEEAELILS